MAGEPREVNISKDRMINVSVMTVLAPTHLQSVLAHMGIQVKEIRAVCVCACVSE